jgi:broad specificity phosphatase PhoE
MSAFERDTVRASSVDSRSSVQSWSLSAAETKSSRLPKRIILVRHCESEGNVDPERYCEEADWRIPLSALGREQAVELGHELKSIVGDDPLYFYCSPYLRTKQTLAYALRSLGDNPVVGAREEPRLTEQQFGNFQNAADMQKFKENRGAFGRFYYRFPDGESGLDVYNRITSFIGTLFRLWSRATLDTPDDVTVVLVTHGLTLRLFLMRWFRLTVPEFEGSFNPDNGCIIVMDRCNENDGVMRDMSAYAASRSDPELPNLSLGCLGEAIKGTHFATASQILEEQILEEVDEVISEGDAKTGSRLGQIPNSWGRFTISEEDMRKIGYEAGSPMFSHHDGPAARLQKIIDEANI